MELWTRESCETLTGAFPVGGRKKDGWDGKGTGHTGTVSTDSSILVRVSAVGDDTTLAGTQRLVADAKASRSRAQELADRFAALLFYVAVAAGVVTFVVWWAIGDLDTAITSTVTVLVIARRHALGLAIPLVIAMSTAVSAKAGILVKDRLALERVRSIDTVLFDKTGTLTKGAHTVTGVAGTTEFDHVRVLANRGRRRGRERTPTRPSDRQRDIRPSSSAATGFRSITGRGVTAIIDGVTYAVGGPALLRQRELTPPESFHGAVSAWEGRGAAVLYLTTEDAIVGAMALEDEMRPEARQAVDELREMGVDVAMITGDARQVGEAVGRDLGIVNVFAEVLPEDKDQTVARLQECGTTVAMVGDGVNDASALARADVGLASVPVPTWPSSRPGSCSPRAIPAVSPASSACRGPATAR